MSRPVGYSEILNPTDEQLGDLQARHRSGELTRLVVEGEPGQPPKAAYFRRNHLYAKSAQSAEFENIASSFQPGPSDPEHRLVPRRPSPVPVYTDEEIEEQRGEVEQEIGRQEKIDADPAWRPTTLDFVRALAVGLILGLIIGIATNHA